MNQEEAFREAIRDNGRMIYGICCRFFGNNDQAKDVYQEILLKIWLNIKNFRGESQIRTWICKIAVNVCLTNITKTRKSTALFVPLTSLDYFDMAGEDDADNEEEEEQSCISLKPLKTGLIRLIKLLFHYTWKILITGKYLKSQDSLKAMQEQEYTELKNL